MPAQTIAGLVADRAGATPVARMVVDEKGNHRTFGQIAFESQRVAAGLLACGVRPGDVVSWQLPNGIETITLALALARLGVVQNPLVMMLREREIGFISWKQGAGRGGCSCPARSAGPTIWPWRIRWRGRYRGSACCRSRARCRQAIQ